MNEPRKEGIAQKEHRRSQPDASFTDATGLPSSRRRSGGRGPEAGAFIYATVIAILFLVFGWIGFRRASFRFAECI